MEPCVTQLYIMQVSPQSFFLKLLSLSDSIEPYLSFEVDMLLGLFLSHSLSITNIISFSQGIKLLRNSLIDNMISIKAQISENSCKLFLLQNFTIRPQKKINLIYTMNVTSTFWIYKFECIFYDENCLIVHLQTNQC